MPFIISPKVQTVYVARANSVPTKAVYVYQKLKMAYLIGVVGDVQNGNLKQNFTKIALLEMV